MSSYEDLLLQTALEASRRASKAVMSRFAGRDEIQVDWKADGSPVTAADLEAERIITDIITAQFPEHAIISEESRQDALNEFSWVIDPIDGTQSFARGIPLFSIQIAVLKNGVPIVGVSAMPALDSVLSGAIGLAAFLNGREVRVSGQQELRRAAISLGGLKYFARYGYLNAAVEIASSASHVRSIGDAYPYHLLASGRLDVVVEAHARIWDIAAHTAIVAAAGGRNCDFEGRPIDYRSTSLVSSNGPLTDPVLQMLARCRATGTR